MKRLVLILCLITPMLSYNTSVATNQLTPLPKLTPTTSGDTQLYRNSTTPTADTADENYPKNTNLIGVSFAEFVFTDLNGHLRSITTPATRIKDVLKNGLKIDGSSIAGGTAITDSDLHLTPEKNAILLPDNLRLERTALVVCEMGLDAQTPFSYDPRTVLKQVLQKLTARQLQLNVGAELEFYLIDNSTAEPWDQQGYLASSTNLESERLKQEIVATLSNAGINVEKIHHEVGPGQFEVVLNYADAIKMADQIVLTKYLIQSVVGHYDLTADFNPKPFKHQNGSGLHLHYSLQDLQTQQPLFSDPHKPNQLSHLALKFIAGNLAGLPDLSAFYNGTANSFARLVPHFEAPVYICWGIKNRSALIRIPLVNPQQPHALRAEIRCPDAASNPYLALAALAASGLYGIEHDSLEYPPAVTANLYQLPAHELAILGVPQLPTSLAAALTQLEHSSLARQLFGDQLVQEYVKIKRHELAKATTANADDVTADLTI